MERQKMESGNLMELLSIFAPFADLDEQARRDLAAQAMTMSVPRRTTIFEQGETPSALVAVLEGTVHLLGHTIERPEMLIEMVKSPDFLLPAAVLENAPYLLRAETVTECRLLLVPAETMRRLVLSEPSVALGLISSLARQFRRMTRQVKNLKLRTALQRVAAYLLALESPRSGKEINLPHNKGTIAAELGMTRESLSRAFAVLESDAIIVDGAKVTICDRQTLQGYCHHDPLIDEAS